MKRLVVLFLLTMSTSTGFAQSSGAQAEVLFREGRDLMAAGKTAEACAAFEESQKLEPTVSTLMNLAGCREKNGQFATAWGLFLDAERQTRAAADPSSRKLHEVAEARAKKLEGRISKLTINVPQKSVVDGLEVMRDQQRIESVMWNRALPIDGGTYTVTAHALGSNEWSTKITVGNEGDTKSVEIPDLRNLPRDLTPVEQAKVEQTSTKVSVEPEHVDAMPESTGRSKVLPLAVSGVALGLVGGSVAFWLSASSTYDDAKAEMVDQSRRDSLEDSANNKRYLAQGFAVAGAATAGVAVWIFLCHPNDQTAATASTRQFVVSPNGIGVAGTF